jgi:ribosomal protein S6E (S10)
MRITNLFFVICTVMGCAATLSAQAVQSVYTDLSKNCRTLERDEESAGYLLQQCEGVGGYKLLVNSGDDRQGISVVKPDGSKHELLFWQIGGGGFSSVGEKAEWRVKKVRGKLVPVALIVRFNLSTDPSDSSKITSYLTVTKITPQQVCRVGEIKPGPNANEEARRAADSSAAKPCVKPL